MAFSLFKSHRKSGHTSLFFKTDVHSHVCPGIDDGAPDVEKSLEIIGGLHELGIKRMITTPHVTDEVFPNDPETIGGAFAELENAVKEAGLPVELTYSAEYRIDTLLTDQLSKGLVMPMPGGHILIECDWFLEPLGLDSFIYDLQSKHNLKPILAHPERYPYYWQKPERIEQLRSRGVLMQVNLLSLAGHYGKMEQRMADYLVERRAVDLVGTDAHRAAHVRAIGEYVQSRRYLKLLEIERQIKNDRIFQIFS